MIVFCDGGSENNGSEYSHGYGSYKLGDEYPERVELGTGATNNECEYGILIAALKAVRERGLTGAQIFSDSRLVVEQVNGRWKLKAQHLAPLLREARELMRETGSTLQWTRRDQIVAQLGH